MNVTKTDMGNLPKDVIDIILSFDGTLKLRNGKYMNQISKSDKRYDILKQIPQLLICYSDIYFIFVLFPKNGRMFQISKCIYKDLRNYSYNTVYHTSYVYCQDGFMYKFSINHVCNNVKCYIFINCLLFLCLLVIYYLQI